MRARLEGEAGTEQGSDAEVVVHWVTLGRVGDWLARRRATLEQEAGGVLSALDGPAAELPTLPQSITERAVAEMEAVRSEHEAQLRQLRAELANQTDAFNVYRTRAHAALKKTAVCAARGPRALDQRTP